MSPLDIANKINSFVTDRLRRVSVTQVEAMLEALARDAQLAAHIIGELQAIHGPTNQQKGE